MREYNTGINNPAYKNGNRIKGHYPCEDCGKDRFIEKRHSLINHFCVMCGNKKERNGRWKGGKRSYYNELARKVMEEHLGRKLTSEEIVHHIDQDVSNNKIQNLHLFNNQGRHVGYHNMLRGLVFRICQEGETCLRI